MKYAEIKRETGLFLTVISNSGYPSLWDKFIYIITIKIPL
jgi:hypothetical protein